MCWDFVGSLPAGFCVTHPYVFKIYFWRRRHPPFMILVNFTNMWQSTGPEMTEIDALELFSRFWRLDFGWHVLTFSKYFPRRRHPLWFWPISLTCDKVQGLKCRKLMCWNFSPDFGGWILGDTSLGFQRIFGGPDILPFRILLNLIKMSSWWGPEMCTIVWLALFPRFRPVVFGWHVLTFSKVFRRARHPSL